MLALINKELKQLLYSSSSYIVAVIFFVTIGIIFAQQFFVDNLAELRSMFEALPYVFIIIIPAITMGSWAEERKSGTFELLSTMPVSELSLITAKFIANFVFAAVLLLGTFPMAITVIQLGQPDLGVIAAGYIGMLFLISAYVSIGQSVSIKATNQITAFIISIALTAILFFIGEDVFLRYLPAQIRNYFEIFGLGSHFRNITKGILDLRDVSYYLAVAFAFLSYTYFSFSRIRKSG